ncbi:zinc finger protein 687a isoform X2 [Channa argus]|uniref:zinc finger protein 687a isoform X2 n=1 Tax=Channa argus TaxID=215402 RepID=UPI00352239E1
MGDMKTPDFDDLLAAFDIPDIDAKEAIQSSPEEERDEVGSNANKRASGSPSCFPCSPASHSEPPVVSVIVKNMVRSESFDNTSCSGLVSQVKDKLGDLTSQLGHTEPADDDVESQIGNCFEGSVHRDQGVVRTELSSWDSSFRPMLNDNEYERHKGAEVGSNQNKTDVINSLNPILNPHSPTSAGPGISTPLSPHSVSPHFSPHNSQKEEICVLNKPSSSSLPQNGSITAEIKRLMHSDEDESEPDLGSPLVIQESPESQMTSPPEFKRREKPQSDLLVSTETTSSDISALSNFSFSLGKPKPPLEEKVPPTSPSHPCSTTPQPQSPNYCLPSVTVSQAVKDDEYPEHVIDERDSPESPPPSETGLVVRNRSSSPDLAPTPGLAVDHNDFHQQEELMQSELSKEDRPGDTQELSEKIAGDGENVKEDNSNAGTLFEDNVSAETGSSPLRPLKVKIKMPTGSITRTVTGVAPKKSARAIPRTVDDSKPLPEQHNTRSKRESLQQGQPAIIADVCAVKEKTTVDTQAKVSLTAVSITKTATLPSISVSIPRVSLGGINLHSLGQKPLNSGITPSPLPPPQSSSRPASIVNSTGAIISKNQTNLVESFNKILNNKNLLPSYKPDLSSPLPAEWGIALPAQGYRCLECGDSFALEQSLARHYDRRSLRIEVTCNHCAKRVAFFNKCSLLLHAREHKERGLIMQCSHLVMKPVPVEQMIGQQDLTPVGQVTSKTTSQPRQAVPNNKGQSTKFMSNQCPECQVQFSSKEEVAEHFQEIKPAHTTACRDCSPPMLLPNSCSAAAHQRIHQGCTPHVCPECGAIVKQFQTHLEETCLHFARRIGYRCSSCLVVFGGLNSVKSHIQQAHCDIFHKCPSCPMAFKSAPTIQNHISVQHPTLTEPQTILIYKCVMCDTVFTHKPLLYAHFDIHLTNQKVHVFKCPECTKLFSQRNSLLDHFKTHKTSILKQELDSPPPASSRTRPSVKSESSEGEGWLDEDKVTVKAERMKTPSGWNCAPCHARYTEREDYITHMAQQHSKILKKFPCNKCESSFTTTSSLRRHIRDKHKVMNRGFHCLFCTENKKTFSSKAMLERHVQLRHTKDAVSQDTLRGGGEDADSSSEQDSSLGAHHKRRGALKMDQDEESTDRMTPVKKLRPSSISAPPESGFRCGPCGFTTENKSLFLEHIGQHRRGGTEGGDLQCLQCGACFTSTSSLSRHRFIVHKVRETFTDNQRNLSMHPAPSPSNSRKHDEKSSLDDSAPASPSCQPSIAQEKEEDDTLACKVCGKHFEKATDLNTHFRTHGMAFINARNAGKTT